MKSQNESDFFGLNISSLQPVYLAIWLLYFGLVTVIALPHGAVGCLQCVNVVFSVHTYFFLLSPHCFYNKRFNHLLSPVSPPGCLSEPTSEHLMGINEYFVLYSVKTLNKLASDQMHQLHTG